jgi:hypothetical protein
VVGVLIPGDGSGIVGHGVGRIHLVGAAIAPKNLALFVAEEPSAGELVYVDAYLSDHGEAELFDDRL